MRHESRDLQSALTLVPKYAHQRQSLKVMYIIIISTFAMTW